LNSFRPFILKSRYDICRTSPEEFSQKGFYKNAIEHKKSVPKEWALKNFKKNLSLSSLPPDFQIKSV
jgi:hypothetical protein